MEQIVPFGFFMKTIERIIQQAQQRPMRIVLSETHDERVLEAARRVTGYGPCSGDAWLVMYFKLKLLHRSAISA